MLSWTQVDFEGSQSLNADMKILRQHSGLSSFLKPYFFRMSWNTLTSNLSLFMVAMLIASTFQLTACSTADTTDTSTPEGAMKVADEYAKDDRFEEAIAKYSDVKNKFPYSRLAAEAELKIADINFSRESYIEAQNDYQLFREFHPKHPKSDYVTFRLAMSYFNQLPTTVDRDLSLADKAISFFDDEIKNYPASKYTEDSKKHRDEALHMLASKEIYIARFYDKHKQFDSSEKRYEGLLKNYPNIGFDPLALFGAANAAYQQGDKDRASQHLKNLYSLFPNSNESKRAKNEFKKLGAD